MTGPSGSDPRSRHWVHPSELPGDPPGSSGGRRAGRARARPANRWAIPTAASLASAVAAFGITALALGAGDDAGDGVPTSIASFLTPGGAGEPSGVAEAAAAATPAIVAITAWTGAEPVHGSGIAYPAGDGQQGRTLVVTSASLVAAVDGIELSDSAGRTVGATLIGTDPDYDLALLEAEIDHLSTLPFSTEPTPTSVGDECVAVGAGHDGEGPWASRGVVRAVGTVVSVNGKWLVDVLEVDAEMSPASAGGAVLDRSGTLLGILTEIGRSDDRVLVVPASTARRSVEQLLEDGTVEHAWLGLSMSDTSSPVRGALVEAVDARGPAARAGVLPGDVVTKVGERTVKGMTGAMREVRRHAVGTEVVLRVVRGTEELDLVVTLLSRP